MKLAFFLLLLFLVGCTEYVEIPGETIVEKVYVENCENPIIEYVNQTVYVNQTTMSNNTCPTCGNATYIYDGNSTRVMTLIRRIEWLESQQSKYIEACESGCLNATDCNDELEECEDTLEELRDLLED